MSSSDSLPEGTRANSNAFNAGNLLATMVDMFMRATGESADEVLKTIELRLKENPEGVLTADSAWSLMPSSARAAAGLDLSDEQNRTVIQTMADIMGVEVRYATAEDLKRRAEDAGITEADRINGWYVQKDAQTGKDVVYVNPTSAVRFTFGHELMHRIQAVAPEIAKSIHDILADGGSLSDNLKALLSSVRDAYKGQRLGERELMEEFDADMLGHLFDDISLAQEVARELERRNAGFGRQMLQAMLDAIDQFLAALARSGAVRTPFAERLFSDYTRKRAQVASLLADFSERYRDAQPGDVRKNAEIRFDLENGGELKS